MELRRGWVAGCVLNPGRAAALLHTPSPTGVKCECLPVEIRDVEQDDRVPRRTRIEGVAYPWAFLRAEEYGGRNGIEEPFINLEPNPGVGTCAH